METATELPTDMSHWASVTRHYVTSDGKYLAVEASTDTIPDGAERYIEEALAIAGVDLANTTMLLRPTVIMPCTEKGEPIELSALHQFPAGTTHEEALANIGYQVK